MRPDIPRSSSPRLDTLSMGASPEPPARRPVPGNPQRPPHGSAARSRCASQRATPQSLGHAYRHEGRAHGWPRTPRRMVRIERYSYSSWRRCSCQSRTGGFGELALATEVSDLSARSAVVQDYPSPLCFMPLVPTHALGHDCTPCMAESSMTVQLLSRCFAGRLQTTADSSKTVRTLHGNLTPP
jgi:hypothetical protein